VWPSRQSPLTENLTLWYVGGFINQGVCKIRRRVLSAQTNFSSVERTFPEISTSKTRTGCVAERKFCAAE
jgi:hypothetical protein